MLTDATIRIIIFISIESIAAAIARVTVIS
jgi:hypothetical protein